MEEPKTGKGHTQPPGSPKPSPPKTGESEMDPLAGGKGDFTELGFCLGTFPPEPAARLPTSAVKWWHSNPK